MTDGLPGVLDALQRYARSFDQLSDESGAHYSASAFVKWIALETQTSARGRSEQEGGAEPPQHELRGDGP